MPNTSTHCLIQLPGRPRYWLPRNPEQRRASIGRLIRQHENIRRKGTIVHA